ncbi:homocitrate synthase [Bipolaris maydis]|uniref:homocitrate synthase n=1 Tax=Cochliobolus heterostrophus TaxID=5016 RepID=UPI0024D627DB|nr:homocitrate synthase [Bipolaris maydis]KAJ6275033.1 homocitrate synthase [Bipolaris maydis]KAJ6285680.1 homocitrate synthase [Bipolaris maydis]
MCPPTEETTNGHANGTNGAPRSKEGFTGVQTKQNPHPSHRSPYQPVGDFLSNVGRFKIIESTLREGEQFANAYFDLEAKIKIAKALDNFGVDYIEVTSPAASEQSRRDCEALCKLGLKAKILTHVRCHMDDARIAVETGVDGLDVVIGTSAYLREHSHGKDMTYIKNTALEVIEFVKSKGKEIRFSSEDSFRSDLVDLLSIYSAVDKVGVDRVGIADTVGCASPRQVYDLVRTLRGVVSCDIETHFHNDSGCAIANAFCALEAGATHIDTSVLGIGERNGITPLGGLMARMIVADREYVTSKYNIKALKEVEDLVADLVEVNIPFNNYITGFCAFTHKAGIHAKAILNNPSTYEIINPQDFGMSRYVHFASRLTGWNAIKSRAEQLGLQMTDAQYKECTAKIKAIADIRKIALDDTDSIIRTYHNNLHATEEVPLLPGMTEEEKAKFAQVEAELNSVNEKRELEATADAQAEVPAAKKNKTVTIAIMSTVETVTQHPVITAENVLRLFPEVNTSLIGGSHNSATNDNALQGYDEEQIRLMDEGVRRAAVRKLNHELGIKSEQVPIDDFKFLTRIHYKSPSDGMWGEHEIDYILFMKADVDLDINPNEVRDSKWVSQEDLKTMFQDKSLKFTPWFKLICESMLFEWWNHLDSGLEKYMGETEIRRM